MNLRGGLAQEVRTLAMGDRRSTAQRENKSDECVIRFEGCGVECIEDSNWYNPNKPVIFHVMRCTRSFEITLLLFAGCAVPSLGCLARFYRRRPRPPPPPTLKWLAPSSPLARVARASRRIGPRRGGAATHWAIARAGAARGRRAAAFVRAGVAQSVERVMVASVVT